MSTYLQHIFELPWTEEFSQPTLERGRKYAREQRVKIIRADDEAVLAACRGSAGQVYEQTIQFNGDPVGEYLLDCYCSCPVVVDCKHCAAVMFHLQETSAQAPSATAEVRLNRDLEQWLNEIAHQDSAQGDPAKGAGTRLLYKLDANRSLGQWVLEIFKARQLKNGELRDIKPLFSIADTLAREPGYMSEEDLRIARLLVAGRSHHFHSGYPLQGRGGAEILELALQTSRLFLDFELQPLLVGAQRSADFIWAEQPSGNYRPQWLSAGQALDAVLPLEPLHYLDRTRGELGSVLHELDDKLACHLTRAPEIPARQALQFSHRLSALNKAAPAPQALTERLIDDIEPRAYLTLGSHGFTAYVHETRRMQQQFEHRAALAFSYDGHLATDKKSKELMVLSGAETLRIQRKPATEKALLQALQKTGLKKATRKSRALPESAGEMFDLPDDQAWLDFVHTGMPALRAANWHIEIAKGFQFDLRPVEDWYAYVEESSGREWFDLELGIVVNGERFSLLPIILHLLRSSPQLLNPDYLAQRADDEYLLANLHGGQSADKSGAKIALPYGRIKPLMATLGELYLGEHNGTSLRLSAPDAARLSALEGLPLVWQGGERLRAFAKRLRESTHIQVSAPAGLDATLREYQLEGLNWMQTLRELEVGGILGDDMGLGKTLQTLAHLLCEKQAERLASPALAVMPTSLIPNWLDEAARFTPQLKVLALHGSNRQKDFASLAEYDLVLTTYALLPRDLEVLQQQVWGLLILDEAQNIKNPASKAAQAARQLEARQRLCLSGTPLENHLGELWSLFHFLLPGWLGDSKTFNRNYRTPIEKHGNSERMQQLTARIKPFLLRRKKEQVARELPPKTEIVHWVDLSDTQRDVYETVRIAMDKKVRDEINRHGVGRSQIIILEALLKLRQVCCDLRLVKTASIAKAARPGTGKLGSLMEMLEELLSEGRRILLFSQFTSMLALIEQELRQRNLDYSILTGETTDRRTPVKDFQSGKTLLFLISLKAGGTGLNLTAADTVIHYDPWWNPAVENQATDRAYRIGQDKPVFVYKLIARGTVEEKIQALQQEKAALAAGVLEGGMSGGWKLEQSDIEALFAPLRG
jgi:superfamily II DNA or RNA helicase